MRLSFEATEAGFDGDEYALICGVRSADHDLRVEKRGRRE